MSLVELGWRRFNFFDKNVVHSPLNPSDKFLGLKDVSVNSWSSSGDVVYLGEARGGVFRLTKDLGEFFWRSFQISLADLKSVGNLLFSVGEDEEQVNSLLKIWETDQLESTAPPVKRSVRVCQVAGTSAPCTTVAVHSDLNVIATGFADGTVAVYTGDVLRDKAVNNRWLRIRDSVPQDGPVTGIAIGNLNSSYSAQNALPQQRYVVFVITSKVLRSFVIENKQVIHTLKHDDSGGCSRHCWSFSERTNQLIVANRDMVYFYEAEQCMDPDGTKGRCHALGRSHDKVQLVQAGGYVALLTKQPALIPTAENEFMSMVCVYDVIGQYIGFSCSLPSLCTLFVLNDNFHILGKDGILSTLTPKHLNAKLEILYRKKFYDVAISLAKRSEDSHERLPSIYAKYADYLYEKGDFENSVYQYKETVGTLEPSYVIKKFLDGSKMNQLCAYLEALHNKNVHNAHHTTILLNCYAKMGDKDKIKQFIERTPDHCDLDGALTVLRSSKYFIQGAVLAMKNKMHGHYLSIAIEDLRSYDKALIYIGKLSVKESCQYLEEYGRILLEKCPEETMKLLIDIVNRTNSEEIDATKLLKIFVTEPEKSAQFIEGTIKKVSGPSLVVLKNTIIELKLREYVKKPVADVLIVKDIVPLLCKENIDRILQMAQIFDCPPLIEHIYRQEERTTDLLHYYMKKGKLGAIIEHCERANDSDLWLDALVFVSKMDSEVDDEIVMRMLRIISSTNCVHPLVVLDILSRSNTLKVSAVKDYVIKWLDEQSKEISSNKKIIEASESRMKDIDKQIEGLNFNVQVMQTTKCCACATSLQVPSVHFLCNHSFHVHCFESYSEQPNVCPACATKQTAITGAQQDEFFSSRNAYTVFHQQLNSSVNAMDLIAEFVKKGLFTPTNGKSGGKVPISPSMSEKRRVGQNPFDEDSFPFETRPSTVRRSPSRAGTVASTRSTNPFEETSNSSKKSLNPFDEQPAYNPFDDDE